MPDTNEGQENYKQTAPPEPIHRNQPNTALSKKTKETLKDYGEELKEKTKNSDSAALVKHKDFNASNAAKKNAQACYEHAKDGYLKYKDISLGTVCQINQDSQAAYAQVDEMNSKTKKDIDEGFKKSIKAIKDLGAKIKKVNEAFCKLENELGDNCNSKQVDLIRNDLPTESSDNCDRVDNQDGDKLFDKWTNLLCKDVKQAVLGSNQLTNKTVQVSSVNALVNLNNLKIVSEDLKAKMEDLKKNVMDTSKFMDEKLKEDCKTYEEAIAQHETNLFAEKGYNLKLQGQLQACEFKNNPLESLEDWDSVKGDILGLLGKTP